MKLEEEIQSQHQIISDIREKSTRDQAIIEEFKLEVNRILMSRPCRAGDLYTGRTLHEDHFCADHPPCVKLELSCLREHYQGSQPFLQHGA